MWVLWSYYLKRVLISIERNSSALIPPSPTMNELSWFFQSTCNYLIFRSFIHNLKFYSVEWVILLSAKIQTFRETCTLFPYFFIFPPYSLIVRVHFFVHVHRGLTLINNSAIFGLNTGIFLYYCSIRRNFALSNRK